MYTLYTWTTPNGRKISIALEEMGLPYDCRAIDITKGEQHAPRFLKINPNNKIPALLDGKKVINESNAILLYLAHKTGRFVPNHGTDAYWEMQEWLMWQASGFGPMLGQAHHFLHYNPGKSSYSETRYQVEATRLYTVLNTRLTGRDTVLDELSIVDFAIWPWVARFGHHRIDLNDFPAVRAYYLRLADRPGFEAGYHQPMKVEELPQP